MASVDNFIEEWSYKYPLDKWYRQKHNLRFNSKEHRETTFIDQLFEYKEDLFYKRKIKDYEERIENEKLRSKGILLKERAESSEYDESLFNSLDLTQFDE